MEAAAAGTLALWGAIGASMASLVTPRRYSRRLLWVAVGLAAAATSILAIALVSGDFTLAYVAKTTSRATPWPYRVAALWGGMEGSLLFYTTLILGLGAAGTRGRWRIEPMVVAITGLAFLLLTAVTSSPFQRLDVPAVDGQGLLAILQHPAMIYHPPILYLGLTTLVVPFALTVAAVIRKDLGQDWVADTRRWITLSWTLLTLGMLAGANWAYIELGWGGFWAWDPVENTSLLPWLSATVFLHLSRVTQRDGRLRRWTAFSAMFPFALSVLGVYLTRSGVTGSIHSFAEDPLIGKILLGAAVLVGVGVTVMALKAPAGGRWGQVTLGRPTWLAVSAGLVSLALIFVLVGSAYPAYLQVFFGRTLVVDPTFFVTTVLPVAIAIALLIGFALSTTWSKANVGRRAVILFVVTGALAVLTAVALADPPVAALALAGVAGAALVLLVRDLIGRKSMVAARLAHLGLAMVLLGAAGSTMGSELTQAMSPGDVVTVGPHMVELKSIDIGEGDRYIYAEGVFLVDGRSELRPQIRAYEDQPRPVAEPALRSTPISDVIIAVSVLLPDTETFEVSVFVRPMVWWVWAGALVMAVGGANALFGKRVVGEGQRRAAISAQPPAGTTTGAIDR